MTKGSIFQNTNDLSKIEIILSQQEKKRKNDKKEIETYMVDLPEIKCKYVEAVTKLGNFLTVKRSEFERLVKQKMFVKV